MKMFSDEWVEHLCQKMKPVLDPGGEEIQASYKCDECRDSGWTYYTAKSKLTGLDTEYWQRCTHGRPAANIMGYPRQEALPQVMPSWVSGAVSRLADNGYEGIVWIEGGIKNARRASYLLASTLRQRLSIGSHYLHAGMLPTGFSEADAGRWKYPAINKQCLSLDMFSSDLAAAQVGCIAELLATFEAKGRPIILSGPVVNRAKTSGDRWSRVWRLVDELLVDRIRLEDEKKAFVTSAPTRPKAPTSLGAWGKEF